MRDRVVDAVKKLGKTFGAFTPGQKVVTLFAVVAIVAGGFVFAKWASAPTYAPLFNNLSATDASAIVDKLNSGGTPYQLADGGATIMVPQSQVPYSSRAARKESSSDTKLSPKHLPRYSLDGCRAH